MLSQHALQVVSQHASQQVSGGVSAPGGFALGVSAPGGSAVGGMSAPGGVCSQGVCVCSQGMCLFQGVSAPGGCMVWGCGLLLWPSGLVPSGLVAFWLKVAFWFGGLLAWCLLVW